MYAATVGTIFDLQTRAAMDGVTEWFKHAKRETIREKPSLHMFTETFPRRQRSAVRLIREDAAILATIREQFGKDVGITFVPNMDELYLTHIQHAGGDKGLSYDHYDGPLRFMPPGAVMIRALVCLSAASGYTTKFLTSDVSVELGKYQFMALDYDRELHRVEAAPSSCDDSPRILLKLHYMICPTCTDAYAAMYLDTTRFFFRLTRTLMEYSNDPQNPLEWVIGQLTNVGRYLNNNPSVFLLVAFGIVLIPVIRNQPVKGFRSRAL